MLRCSLDWCFCGGIFVVVFMVVVGDVSVC